MDINQYITRYDISYPLGAEVFPHAEGTMSIEPMGSQEDIDAIIDAATASADITVSDKPRFDQETFESILTIAATTQDFIDAVRIRRARGGKRGLSKSQERDLRIAYERAKRARIARFEKDKRERITRQVVGGVLIAGVLITSVVLLKKYAK